MLVNLVVEGREATTLADSGSKVNTMTPAYVWCHKFPVLPLKELVDHPLNLIGLGGRPTSPLGFIILWVHMTEITGYNEDIVFLIMPDQSEFLRHVPLVLGTCMLCRIIIVIKESEIDRLSVTLAMAQASCLLSRCGTTDLGEGAVGDTDKGIDKLVLVREHMR